MPLAVVLILLVVGWLLFHYLNPWTFTELAANWGMADFTVNLVMAYCVIKVRHRKGVRSTCEPENKKLRTWLTSLTATGVAAMLTSGSFAWAELGDVEAIGQQGHRTLRQPGNAALGASLYTLCATCHGTGGQGNALMNAPKLAGQGGWYLKRQILNYKTGLRGTHRGDTFGRQMRGIVAGLVNEQAVDNVVAYIGTLPDTEPAATIDGNTAAGAEEYRVCADCHGKDGAGVQALNAPRLAGMSDWYLERQLHNFRNAIRGSHPEDYHGAQMGLMAQSLSDEQAVQDVVAYINTL